MLDSAVERLAGIVEGVVGGEAGIEGVGGLAGRVAENVRVRVEGIRVRYAGKGVGVGLGVRALEVYTCNASWERGFVNRKSGEPLRKKMTLEGFGVYVDSLDPTPKPQP